MVNLIKTIAKGAWLALAYSTMISSLVGFLPIFVTALPPVNTSVVIMSVITAAVSTLNWLFTPGIIKVAFVIWLALPFVKLTLYVSYKVTHV